MKISVTINGIHIFFCSSHYPHSWMGLDFYGTFFSLYSLLAYSFPPDQKIALRSLTMLITSWAPIKRWIGLKLYSYCPVSFSFFDGSREHGLRGWGTKTKENVNVCLLSDCLSPPHNHSSVSRLESVTIRFSSFYLFFHGYYPSSRITKRYKSLPRNLLIL
jgi:hypothetical protein